MATPVDERELSASTSDAGGWVAPAPAEAWPVGRVLRRAGAGVRDGVQRIEELLGLYPTGAATLVVAAVLGLVGWPTGWFELRVAALLCLLLVLVALTFTLYGTKYRVDLGVSSDHVVVGEPVTGDVLIGNDTGRRALPARVDVPVGDDVATFQVPSLATRASYDGSFQVPTARRGVVVVGPVSTVRGDPFGLAGRESRFTDTIEVFVHPRTVALPGRESGFVHDLEGHPSATLSASDTSFHALREYVPGDDRRHVHWRSSARTGALMVRQYEETRQARVAIGIDTLHDDWFGDDEFEEAVSIAASVAQQAHREASPLAVFAGSDALPAVNPRRTLDELSRVERHTGGGLLELVETLRLRAPQASLVVVITGSKVALQRVRSACAAFDVDTRVLAVQVDEADAPSVATVGGLTVLRLQHLADLPRAMRRAML